MGMDVYGRKPTGKHGQYFRGQWAAWHDLARYCNMIAPDICAPCKLWHYNDGDGLDALGAAALADALRTEVVAGRAAVYAASVYPDDAPKAEFDDPPFRDILAEVHPFVRNVTDFVCFLRGSGGFEIW